MKQTEYLFYNTNHIYFSARKIHAEIKKFLPEVHSLIDFGCGMAAFAKVFQEGGVKDIKILDHPSLDISKCLLKKNFEFIPCNLDIDLPKPLKADLAICTEVLEHINLKRSLKVLDFISTSADIIIFSAAVPGQGGIGHINEQRHKFWIKEFRERGFDYSDAFKSNIIQDEDIVYWLRQNLFIFHRNQSDDSPLKNSKWLGEDFEVRNSYILEKQHSFLQMLKVMPKAFLNSSKNKLGFK